MAAHLRLILVVIIVLAVTAVLAPIQLLAWRMHSPTSRYLPLLWHRITLKLVGTRVHVAGRIPRERPLLIVSNHVSWSDILILGSVMELCFIAKAEVRTWPGISVLARLQRTVFVDRERRRDSANQANTIAKRLLEGDAMVLFAEGTTGDGNRVGSFKSALFGAAQAALTDSHLERVTIQPVALAYTRLFGMPLGRFHQTRASWPGDMALGPHLKRFLLDGAYDVEVVFGQPMEFTSESSRKEVAQRTQMAVRKSFALAMRMREVESEPVQTTSITG
ncbi:MAG: 1-acyl-sn-glycerol-3-phosphate acyltransferase [Rhizobiaceae bacterium]